MSAFARRAGGPLLLAGGLALATCSKLQSAEGFGDALLFLSLCVGSALGTVAGAVYGTIISGILGAEGWRGIRLGAEAQRDATQSGRPPKAISELPLPETLAVVAADSGSFPTIPRGHRVRISARSLVEGTVLGQSAQSLGLLTASGDTATVTVVDLRTLSLSAGEWPQKARGARIGGIVGFISPLTLITAALGAYYGLFIGQATPTERWVAVRPAR